MTLCVLLHCLRPSDPRYRLLDAVLVCFECPNGSVFRSWSLFEVVGCETDILAVLSDRELGGCLLGDPRVAIAGCVFSCTSLSSQKGEVGSIISTSSDNAGTRFIRCAAV